MHLRLLPLAMAAGAVLTLVAACGDDSDPPAAPSPTASGTGVAAAPATPGGPTTAPKILVAPAKKFSLNQSDLGTGFITDISGSGDMNIEQLGAETIFDSPSDGQAKLATWGFVDAYRAGYIPEGRTQTLLNGGYAVNIDSYLFGNAAGAKSAYEHLDARVRASGAQTVNTVPVGEQSVTRLGISGKLPNSNVDRAIHQTIMRRNNLVVVIQTQGAEPFMRADTVVALTKIVDQKALGGRPIVEPTPLSNFTPPTYPTRSATPPAATVTPAQGR